MENYSFTIINYYSSPTVRSKEEFEHNLTADTIASIQDSEHRSENEMKIEIWNDYCQLVDEISKNATIGHDEKFQLFMCLCLRYNDDDKII